MDLRASPGSASRARMLRTWTALEVRLALRQGERVLLTLGIPLGLLVFFSLVDALPTGGARRVDFLTPGVLALAITSAGFTGLAIATGFERSYGVLARLGTTPMPRSVLLLAKALGVVVLELVQVTLIALVAGLLGWHPHGSVPGLLLLVVVGTVAMSGLGLLIAGLLPALVTLAAANAAYLVLLLLGAVVLPADELGPLEGLSRALPTGALSHGLRSVLLHGSGLPVRDLMILLAWAVASLGLASKTFRWSS
jgi:ABC-2 type transport system permease protein